MNICNKCGSDRMYKNGYTQSGSNRLRCQNCGHSQSVNPKPGNLRKRDLPCKFCGSEKTNSHGKNDKGERFQNCHDCGKTWNIDRAPEVKPIVNCPRCDSENTINHGNYKGKKKRKCKDCQKVWYQINVVKN